MKTLIKVTDPFGDDIFIVTDKIVAFVASKSKGGANIWVGPKEEDYFYVKESPQEIVQLMYGVSEVPSWLQENGGEND